MSNVQKGIAPLVTILAIVVVLAVVGLIYYSTGTTRQSSVEEEFDTTKSGNVPVGSSEKETRTGWTTYRNDQMGFEFMYPESWGIKRQESRIAMENPRVDGSLTTRYGYPYGYPGSWEFLQVALGDEASGELRMILRLIGRELITISSDRSAFSDAYERFDYFHGPKLEEGFIDGFKTNINLRGCYECYDESPEFVERVSKEVVSLTCNTTGVCLQIELVNMAGESDLSGFFLNDFLPTLRFDKERFESIEYEVLESKG